MSAGSPSPAVPTETLPDSSTSAGGKAEALRTIAGLLAVAVGLTVLAAIALVGMGLVKGTDQDVVSIATSSFGVIGTIVGAYFGVKVGNDSTQKAIDNTQSAIAGLRDEAAKAQAFAAHLDPSQASAAIDEYQRLTGSGSEPVAGGSAAESQSGSRPRESGTGQNPGA